MSTERIDGGIGEMMGGTTPNVFSGEIIDGTKGNLGDIIGPQRTLAHIIGVEALKNDDGGDFGEVYVLTQDELTSFESKIGPDILPEAGKVILVKADMNSENSMVEIVSQDMADRVMETKGSYDLHKYYSKEHPNGFTTGFGSDMEEM